MTTVSERRRNATTLRGLNAEARRDRCGLCTSQKKVHWNDPYAKQSRVLIDTATGKRHVCKPHERIR